MDNFTRLHIINEYEKQLKKQEQRRKEYERTIKTNREKALKKRN